MFVQFGKTAISKVHVIQQSQTHNCVTFVHDNKPYFIGFPEQKHAKSVANVLGAFPHIHWTRHETRDITREVDVKLVENGWGSTRDRVTIDTRSELVIGKDESDPSGVYDIAKLYDVREHDYETFTSLPFSKHLGVVLPMDLIFEDDRRLVFAACGIDPSFHPDSFRRHLDVY